MKDITVSNEKYNIPVYISGEERSPRIGVIVIHEVWGVSKHIRNIADRLAEEGYLALAPDLLSQTGITEKVDQSIMAEVANPATRDEAQKRLREAMIPTTTPEFGKETIERLKVCYDYLKDKYHVEKISVIGFCFGGTYSYALAASGVELSAAVPFYGHAPQDEAELAKIDCPIYAFYGEKDSRLMEALPQLEANMKKLGKDFTYKIYPNTGHAFMNDTNPSTYNEESAKDAWKEAVQFLKTSNDRS